MFVSKIPPSPQFPQPTGNNLSQQQQQFPHANNLQPTLPAGNNLQQPGYSQGSLPQPGFPQGNNPTQPGFPPGNKLPQPAFGNNPQQSTFPPGNSLQQNGFPLQANKLPQFPQGNLPQPTQFPHGNNPQQTAFSQANSQQQQLPDGNSQPQFGAPQGNNWQQNGFPPGNNLQQHAFSQGNNLQQQQFFQGNNPPQPAIPRGNKLAQPGYPQGSLPQPQFPSGNNPPQPAFPPGSNPPQPGYLQGSLPQPQFFHGNKPSQPPLPPGNNLQQPGYPQGGLPQPAFPQGNNPPQPGYPQGMYSNNQQSRFVDLMQERNLMGLDICDNDILLPGTVCNPETNCDSSIMRCTMTGIPESTELLNKCRLPLGLTLQPFRDLKQLTVFSTQIVRCRYCRTYINPFVYLPDVRHWKCNLCFRLNDLPEEFSYDPESKTFGDPTRRPEIKQATIEYIAPNEYMLRPPQPTLYLFVFDVGSNAVDCGYLHTFSEQLLICLDQLPGNERTLIGFIGVDSSLHFFQFLKPDEMPRQYVINDVDEAFLPTNFGLIVELKPFKESVRKFVQNLPTLYESSYSTNCCLGSALTLARDLIAEIGGRITIMLATIPNIGIGALNSETKSKDDQKPNVSGSSDFYKTLALDCTGKQIALDLFVMGERFVDLATLSDISKFSSGSVYYFPGYHFVRDQIEVKRFQKHFNRYLTRKIGLEAVLRIRCSRGLSLHSFHGNFFVRSPDLLALANVNPDAAIGVQVSLDENLDNQTTVCFQAALLYTSSKGERRIRVHTICLPVVNDYSRIFNYFDVKASISLLAKMAAERAFLGSDLVDCREAMINAVTDALAAYNRSVGIRATSLLTPADGQLKYFALYILGLLKNAFSNNSRVRSNVDMRVAAMLLFKNAPLEVILLEICPSLYPIHNLDSLADDEMPQRLPLSYERVNRDGAYLLDTGSYVYLYVCGQVNNKFLEEVFGVSNFAKIDEDSNLPLLDTALSESLQSFLRILQINRSVFAPLIILRDDSVRRELFSGRLIEDRTESSHSYVEFVQHLKREINTN